MIEKAPPPQEDLHHDITELRDDHRPPGAPRAGIAAGQIDTAAALAATTDGAGEPLPPVADRLAQGLGAGAPTPAEPQPGSAETAPAERRTFDR